MDLNKDHRDIYTIDAESYTQQRKQHKEEPRSLLSFLINLLLFILAIVISFFLYNIIKNKYTLNDVLNKEKIFNTFHISTEPTKAIAEVEDIEALAQQIVTSMEIEKEAPVIAKVEIEEKVEPKKLEVQKVEVQKVSHIEVVKVEEKVASQKEIAQKEERVQKIEIAVESPKVVSPQLKEEKIELVEHKVIKEKVSEEKVSQKKLIAITKEKPKEIKVVSKTAIDVSPKEEDLLSDDYLKRMAEEMNRL